MNFIKNLINEKAFLLSLSIGLLLCYLTVELPEVIYEHPNPHNLNTVYNKDNKCYKYISSNISCK